MNQHVTPPPGKLTADEFWNFIKDRPREERWQLIDGEPFLMMSPATLPHQRIGRNLARLLDDALAARRPELIALLEVGLRLEHREDFRPVADVVVVDAEVPDEVYGSRFYLAAEVLSPSNTHEYISRKRLLYSESPDCLYVLILSQRDFGVEVWSRADGWKGRIYRSPEDRIELPELGLSCCVRDFYRGTPVLADQI